MSITKAVALGTRNASDADASDADTLELPSRLLGSVAVRRAELFEAPAGIYAFEAYRTWALVPAGRDGLWWLQSAEREDLVFLLADPFAFFPGYEVDVSPAELAPLGATETTPLMVLVIVTLPARAGDAPSANLRAPLVLNPERRVVRQLVLSDESLSLTAPLSL